MTVDDVTVGGIGRVEDGGEELLKGGEAGGTLATGGTGAVLTVGVRGFHALEEGIHDAVDRDKRMLWGGRLITYSWRWFVP